MTVHAAKFPAARSREQRKLGATDAANTPLLIRTAGMSIPERLHARIRTLFSSKLGRLAHRIERLTVRFEDLNGPRGGNDVVCRTKAVLHGLPSVVARADAPTAGEAFGRAAAAMVRSVRKALGRAGQPPRSGAHARPASQQEFALPLQPNGALPNGALDEGSVIGRRVGRHASNLGVALERPEKLRRDMPVDTAVQGVSATDRKAGAGTTARRNSKKRAPAATATLEDSSRARPSRKSTRKSANRTRAATNLQARAIARTSSSSARAHAARHRGAARK